LHHALSANVKPKAAPEAAYPLISQRLARPGRTGQATRLVRRQPHSFEAPDAFAGGGATCVGAAAAAGRFGAAGFLATAAAGAVGATDEVGRGESNDALAADDGALLAGGGTARADGPEPGSAVMMLTGGVDAAVGNSALVGRPVGIDEDSIATGAAPGGAFHNGA